MTEDYAELCMLVGAITLQWGSAEHALDQDETATGGAFPFVVLSAKDATSQIKQIRLALSDVRALQTRVLDLALKAATLSASLPVRP